MAEYIERDKVLANRVAMTEYDEGGWDTKVEVVRVEDIEAIPTADVAPVVHGWWKAIGQIVRTPFVPNYFCSICNDRPIQTSNYCPNCGAKMDLEET